MNPQAKAKGGKVRKVMHEFRTGSLKSSSGQKVTNPKQAIAIALSEQRRVKGMAEGGKVPPMPPAKPETRYPDQRQPTNWQDVQDAKTRAREDKAIRERKYAKGGALRAKINRQDTRHGQMDMPFSQLNKYAGMREGGKVKEAQMEMRHARAMKKAGVSPKMVREEMAEAKKYARGGGIESRGKTRGTFIKMAKGGSVRGGGCEMRGKTKGRMV